MVTCPYCGEPFETLIDLSAGSSTYIEDCQVCCAPMTIEVRCRPGRVDEVRVSLA